MRDEAATSPEVSQSRDAWTRVLPGLLTLGLVLLALWGGFCGARWGIANYTNDDGTYWGSALALEAGRGYTIDFSPVQIAVDRFPPGWPMLLAVVLRIFGRGEEGILAGQVLNLVLWAGSLGLAYHSAAKRFGRPLWLVWVGLAFLAVHPLVLETVPLLMSESLTVLLMTVSLLMWLRQPTGLELGALGVIFGYAFITRYAVLPVLLALLGATAWRLRLRAWPLLLGLAVPVLPWFAWWSAFRGDGYVSQAAYWSAASLWIQLGSLAISLGRSFLQALPSLVLPGVYLSRYPLDTEVPWTQPLLVLLALAWDLLLLRALWRLHKEKSLPAGIMAGVVGYVLLVTLWQSAFLNLKEHLPLRLLLPILPVALVWVGRTFEDMFRGLGRTASKWAGVVLLLGSISLLDAVRATGSILAHSATLQRQTMYIMDQIHMDRARFPKRARVATDFGGMYHQATGDKAFALTGGLDPVGIETTVMAAGTQLFFIVMSPKHEEKGVELWWGAHYLNKRYPGLIVPVKRADGHSTSWYQVDQKVWAHHRRRLLQQVQG